MLILFVIYCEPSIIPGTGDSTEKKIYSSKTYILGGNIDKNKINNENIHSMLMKVKVKGGIKTEKMRKNVF